METEQDDRGDTYLQAIERALRSPEIIRQHTTTGRLVVVLSTVPATGNSVVREWTLRGDAPEYVVTTANLEPLQHAFKASR